MSRFTLIAAFSFNRIFSKNVKFCNQTLSGETCRINPAVCFQCSDGNSAQENSSLKRVAVVEDFFDIIYAMHVEMGADPGRAPKHAGQKKTYKAVSESCQSGFQL